MTNDLIAIIKDKQAQIAQLQAELEEARRLLFGSPAPTTSPSASISPSHGPPTPDGNNSVTWAAGVLKQAGKPLHVSQIIAGIQQMYGQSVKYTTVVSNFARLVKQNKTFYRHGPNVFGLIEWRDEGLFKD